MDDRKAIIEGWIASLLPKLQSLESNDVLLIGSVPEESLSAWSSRVTELVVIIGNRRQHYLERHAELLAIEHLIIETIVAPDEVHRNRLDPLIAILYRRIDERFVFRIALLISEQEALQNSVLSARIARVKEVDEGRDRGRIVWKKEE